MMIAGGLYLAVLTVVIAARMLMQAGSGRLPLACAHNVFLGGVIVFFNLSAMHYLFGGMTDGPVAQFVVANPNRAALMYCAAVTLFLLCFEFAYKAVPVADRLSRAVRSPYGAGSTSKLLVLAVVLTAIAIPMTFLVNVPLIGVLSRITGIGFMTMAAGAAALYWGRSFFNPAFASPALLVILVNFAAASASGYGRRDALSVLIAVMWGLYHGYFAKKRLATWLPQAVAIGFAALIALGALTSIRGEARDAGQVEKVKMIFTESRPLDSVREFVAGQSVGRLSMWLMENYPDRQEYTPFRTLIHYVTYPVPRVIWEGKPDTLSGELASLGNVRGVNDDVSATSGFNLAPGFLGQTWTDGGYVMVAFYALLVGLALRFFDRILIANPERVGIVLPIGASLGQLIGSPRGSFSPMFFMYTFAAVTCFIGLHFVLKFMGFKKVAVIGAAATTPQPAASPAFVEAASEGGNWSEVRDTHRPAPSPGTIPESAERPNWSSVPT